MDLKGGEREELWDKLEKLAKQMREPKAQTEVGHELPMGELYEEMERFEIQAMECVPWHLFPNDDEEGVSQVTVWIVIIVAALAGMTAGVKTSFTTGLVMAVIVLILEFILVAKWQIFLHAAKWRGRMSLSVGVLERNVPADPQPCKFLFLRRIPESRTVELDKRAARLPQAVTKQDVIIVLADKETNNVDSFVFGNREKAFLIRGDDFPIKNPDIRENIAKLRDKYSQLARSVTAISPANSLKDFKIDWTDLRAEWGKIVIDEEVERNLLISMLHFVNGTPHAPRGILLKGPPGTGKSMIAMTLGKLFSAQFFSMSLAGIKGAHIGETGANVRRLWQEARAVESAIIFIDECEGAFTTRGSDQGDSFAVELVQNFLTEWDGTGSGGRVLVVGATNRPELLDNAVISRFTDVFELTPIGEKRREDLVYAVARQVGVTTALPQSFIKNAAGLSGREVRNAIQQAMRLATPGMPTEQHFEIAIDQTRGKASTRTDSAATWDTLVLPADLKKTLMTRAEMVRQAEILLAKGVPMSRTMLLYGPPGTGKTQIARTMANEAGVAFLARSTTDLKGQYLGHAAARVAQTFDAARAQSPAILFVDEFDALTASRDGRTEDQLMTEALTQFLQELDGISAKSGFVFVIAATNRRDSMDAAILSRFGYQVEIGLPGQTERLAILETLLKGRPFAPEINLGLIARHTEGYSGRDLRELISSAFQHAVTRVVAAGADLATVELTQSDLFNTLGLPLEGDEFAHQPDLEGRFAQNGDRSKFCSNCGSQFEDAAAFCTNCGTAARLLAHGI